ncbi:Bgt-20447 [Blumeria graminis f. sp. tritici]|uniref:Bgt-20447 n=2 Tax=Blumeria graminis f. sp. tritici TaxID=62690 RepID=A0A9X9L982_BLUGR|nr:Bgt-20447 [Blumeria graminis f. sp. tritici]
MCSLLICMAILLRANNRYCLPYSDFHINVSDIPYEPPTFTVESAGPRLSNTFPRCIMTRATHLWANKMLPKPK